MSKTLPTKSIAKRLDLNYFKSPNGIVLAKRLLILVCGTLAGLWAALYSTSANDGIYNPGPVSSAHAFAQSSLWVSVQVWASAIRPM